MAEFGSGSMQILADQKEAQKETDPTDSDQ